MRNTDTETIESAVHRYNFLPIKFSTKDAIKEQYHFIRFPIDETKFNALNTDLIVNVFQKYKHKGTTFQLENAKEKEYETLLNNNISNHIISTEWLDISTLTKADHVPARSWREITARNGDSFYVCFVYLLFTEVIICNKENCLALQYDIFENFKVKMREFYKDIDLNETLFVLKKILSCEDVDKDNDNIMNKKTFDKYFNTFSTFVREMTLYIRYCLYICMKDLIQESLDFILEEGTEPFPLEQIFEILSKLFNVNLTVKFGNKKIIQKGSSSSNIQFYILHFGGRYHLYSTDLDLSIRNNVVLYNNLTLQTKNILARNQKEKICECSNTNRNFVYQSEFSFSLICRKCLETRVANIMKKRIQLYYKNNHYNKEMYLSPIYVNEQTSFRDVVLSNVFELQGNYQSYLSQVFYTTLKQFCCECQNLIENEHDINTASCGCVYDSTCASKIRSMSFDNFFLKEFHDSNLRHMKFNCKHCKRDSSLTLSNNINYTLTDNEKAQARKLFISYCINCKVTISSKVFTPFDMNNHPTQTQVTPNYKCQLRSNDRSLHNQLFPSYYHFLCSGCSNEITILNCAFCNKKHHITKEQLINERNSKQINE